METTSISAPSRRQYDESWWPGPWLGGATLVLGPLLVCTGVLLRVRFHFFFPEQLAAYDESPTLMVAAYACFVAGMMLLCPAVATLGRMIGVRRPGWAAWGATLVIAGLFARTFHGGIDHLAFQLVDVQGLDRATDAVADSYSAWHVMRFAALFIMVGWVVLAVGAYLSRALGLVGSVALGLMSALPLGTLKGTTTLSVVAVAGLCVALVPLGVRVLRDGPRPSRRAILLGAGTVAAVVLLVLFGPTG